MTKHTILFLAANPVGTDRLALDKEARAIHVELERSGFRDSFKLVTRWAAEPLDLLRELRKLKPTVVHFSGHGGHGGPSEPRQDAGPRRDVLDEAGPDGEYQHGLFFHGPDGRPQLVSIAALEETFGAAGSSVKLVVLNACYSEVQAKALLAHVDCVVGMSGSIHDDPARSFAIGFYGGIGERESVAAAYKQGCAAISLEGLPDVERPRLKARHGVDVQRLVLVELPAVVAAVASPSIGWKWHSSVKSTEVGDVSMLAIVETIAASAAYAWIAWRFGTLHLTVSACAMPLILLQTPSSGALALKWYLSLPRVKRTESSQRAAGSLTRRGISRTVVGIILVPLAICLIFLLLAATPLLCILLAAVVIGLRAAATTVTTLRHPLYGVSQIARNWWCSVMSIDSCYPFEILPGAYQKLTSGSGSDDHDTVALLVPQAWMARFAQIARREAGVVRALAFIVSSVIISPFALVALFYRWSLKGSALIYSPLIWVVHSATAKPLRDHLEDIHTLAHYRLARSFSAFVVLLFVIKTYIYYAWRDIASSWHALPGHRLLDAVVMPEAFPAWQIAATLNGILAWIVYFIADSVITRWKRGSLVNEDAVEAILRWLSLVRGILSVYSIVCGIYLAASLSSRFDLPAAGSGILPWL